MRAPEIRVEDIGTLLRSPFFSGAEPRTPRRGPCRLRLRELGAVEMPLDRVREVTGRFCPDLLSDLNRIPPPPGALCRTFRLGAPVLSCARGSGLARRPPPHQRRVPDAHPLEALLGEFAALETVASLDELG